MAKDRPPFFLHPAVYKVKHQNMFTKFVSTSPREYRRSLRIAKQVEYMSAPTDNFIGHSIAETWGPPLISTFLAAMYVITTNVYASPSNNRRSIYGITVLQTFYYYNHYGNTDRSAWLILVAVIL